MTLGRVISLVPDGYRLLFWRCVALAVAKCLLNLVSFAMFIPVLLLFLQPDAVTDNAFVSGVAGMFGISDARGTMALCCGMVVAVVVLKNLALLLVNRNQNAAYVSLFRVCSERLFRSYMGRGLLYVKDHNSSTLTGNVCLASYSFVFAALAPAVTIFSETILVVAVIALTALVDVWVVVALLAFVVPVALLYKAVMRDGLLNLGRREYELRRNQLRIVQEALKGYAEVTVNNALPAVLAGYDREMKSHAAVKRKIEDRMGAATGLLEAVVIILMVAAVAVISFFDIDRRALAVVMGVFGVVLVKVVASARTIINSYAMIKSNGHTMDIVGGVADALPAADVAAKGRIGFERELRAEGLSFSYDTGRDIICGLDLSVRKGERIGIRGESGAGKTTLFYLLLGLYRPSAGTISVDGLPLEGENIRLWQNRIGFVSQDVFIADSTIADNIMLGDMSQGRDGARLDYAVDMASLRKFVDSLPDGVDTRIGEAGARLSGGLKQRIGIARALYKRADVLFFDEATSSLDAATEHEIMESIDRLSRSVDGITILMIAHNESTLAGCDRIIEIGGRHLAAVH